MQPRKFSKLNSYDQYSYMKALRDMVANAMPANADIQVVLADNDTRLTISNGRRKTYQFYIKGNSWVMYDKSDKSESKMGDSIDVSELIELAHETANTSSIISLR